LPLDFGEDPTPSPHPGHVKLDKQIMATVNRPEFLGPDSGKNNSQASRTGKRPKGGERCTHSCCSWTFE